jgi:hypothetical protein
MLYLVNSLLCNYFLKNNYITLMNKMNKMNKMIKPKNSLLHECINKRRFYQSNPKVNQNLYISDINKTNKINNCYDKFCNIN